MKLAYCSDTHLDFWCNELNPQNPKFKRQITKYIDKVLKPEPADCLVIAGDIGHYNNQNIEMLIQLKSRYNTVFVVSGNHDLYLISKSIQSSYSWDSLNRLAEFKEMCKVNEIIFLDGDVHEFLGLKIGGTGMWYDLPSDDDIAKWTREMNDSRLIMNGPVQEYSAGWGMYSSSREVNPSFNTQKYYLQEVKKLKQIKECDIFISHVSPIIIPFKFRDSRYKGDSSNIFYQSDNIANIKQLGAKFCIFGHTHIEADFKEEGIRFLASAIGYPQEHKQTSIKVLEI